MLKISSKTLVSEATRVLEEMVLSGKLKVGARLKELELEKELGISRTPLREALVILESQGLIVNYPHKGRFVKKINIREIEEVCEVRIALEGLAVRLAHKHVKQKDIEDLKKILDRMEQAMISKNSTEFIDCHEQFHATLIALSGNSWLERELYKLRKLMRWHRFYYCYHEANFSYSVQSHRLQLEMLSDPGCDEDELVRIDEHTTRRGCELLIQHIKSSGKASDIIEGKECESDREITLTD
ncbi:MAG: GntR family transcriptional regulator [Sutterella sp.]|jgi:DNA-binding GntR family transcriptional regulator|nr:GntR family transcriptional regulator [Sutterella sp.]